MEATPENPSQLEIKGLDSPADSFDGLDYPISPAVYSHNHDCDHDHLLAELDSVRQAYESLQSKSIASMEENLLLPQHKKEEAFHQNENMMEVVEELSRERDTLPGESVQLEASFKGNEYEFEKKIEEELKEREEIKRALKVSRGRIEVLESEKKEMSDLLLQNLDSIKSVKENLINILECIDDEKVIERENSEITELRLEQESRALLEETKAIVMLARKAEASVSEFKQAKKKENKELENSVVSLTEENRDTNSFAKDCIDGERGSGEEFE